MRPFPSYGILNVFETDLTACKVFKPPLCNNNKILESEKNKQKNDSLVQMQCDTNILLYVVLNYSYLENGIIFHSFGW